MHPNPLKGIAITCCIGVFLLFPFLSMQTRPQEQAQPTQTRTVTDRSEKRAPSALPRFSSLPSASFYRTIIDNNLFRPLGWTRPVSLPAYRLLGTMVPKDGKTPPQAIIQVSTAGNKTHIASIGDTLDADTKIVDIQPKQATLDRAGQQTTLKLNPSPWISTAKGRFSHRR